MKYVANHLTRQHLFHAPHRWFFALLLSPIHAAELHYQKHYHLQFAHARKLFLFDLSLIGLIIALTGLTGYWFWYDPTISEQIDVKITVQRHDTPGIPADRILSGEHLTFVIAYTNNSDQSLTNAALRLHTPDHFFIDHVQPHFNTSTLLVPIGHIPRGGQGAVEISGLFYNEPNHDDHFITELQYQPTERRQTETRLSSVFLIARGSILETKLDLPTRLPANGTTMATLTIHNNSHHNLPLITIPFPTGTTRFKALTPTVGTTTPNQWSVPFLNANQTAHLPLTIQTNSNDQETDTLSITPFIFPNPSGVAQTELQKNWTVARPNVSVTSAWQNSVAAPGTTQTLTITLRNRGTEILQNGRVTVSLPNTLIDTTQWTKANNQSRLVNNEAVFSATNNIRLNELTPGSEVTLTVNVPIKRWPTGAANQTVTLPIRIEATVSGLNSEFRTQAVTPAIPLATALRVTGEARYYTADGDQLGRGPLPPQVGKETKYALLLHVMNATGQADALTFSATLPANILWTGKTSVSRGQEITYDPNSRRISWRAAQFPALGELSLFMEVGFKPTESDRGRHVTLLQNIQVTATDSALEIPLQASVSALTSALPNDSLAQEISTAVR